ncbi:zf-C3HC-domain-containing protein [Lentinula aff. detonsa]|uniref:Zf-C3HC-domain-containing protein n=1 Tax=Lentinula aff. detonsa TaxID=2804958 RepID=A0AA38L6Q2_9AGAR|nr:zf-C3HC-domain-containing protein [Lentinula aff. detonsa]
MSINSGEGSQSIPTIRATKRKLDDAFQSLDAAVASKELPNQPPPTKKPFNARSIYSTLTKYGIRTKNVDSSNSLAVNFPSLSKSTPNLSAILARAATKTRKAFPMKSGESSNSAPPLSPLADYRPSSIPSFLGRLETFKLATYANKPPALDAVAAAKCGWINDGKDRLVCGLCNASWVVAGKEGLSKDAANALIEKQRASLVQNHKTGCPWRTRQCDDSIYRIPLQSPASTVQNIKLNAAVLDTVLQDVEIKHPLTASQVNSLQSIVTSLESSPERTVEATESSSSLPHPSPEFSETAIITSLFGWTLSPERPRSTSTSRSNSRVSSALRTPSLSRSTSVAPGNSLDRPRPLLKTAVSQAMARDNSLVHCVLCQRRVGLWAFAPPKPPPSTLSSPEAADTPPAQLPKRTNSILTRRQFDLLKEHRSYCPYVVRSTVVPTLPSSPSVVSVSTPRTSNLHLRSSSSGSQLNGPSGVRPGVNALEGWRAVLTVVMRYRMAQRHQLSRIEGILAGDEVNEQRNSHDGMEVDDGVDVMVQGVKARGGSDLLRYVKGLLG